ncbi:MAG: hypothetical protein ACM3X5_03065 [Bacillota bacterium]
MRTIVAFIAALTLCELVHATPPSVVASPVTPSYGQSVTAEVKADWPVFLPAIRYAKAGNDISVDFEYTQYGFSPPRPDFAYEGANLGELAPGNYTLRARLFDIANPSSPPTIVSTNFTVNPPSSWGVYLVPQAPLARQRFSVLVNSAAYLYTSSLRYSVNGSTVRIDFDYDASAPAWGAVPTGESTTGLVSIAGLAPGSYQVEVWGRPSGGTDSQRQFTLPILIPAESPVVEFYAESLDHYFMSAGADEIDLLDGNPSLGWKRTGLGFKAWLTSDVAPSNAVPVCRFYARGPNSHFYTASADECQLLKALELQQRAEAQAKNQIFLGWGYEAIAFYALLPQNGVCPVGSDPVYRAYNARAAEDDSNHRFTSDPLMHVAMVMSWNDEGIAFCAPH